MNSKLHGNWTIDNAKSRLHEFFQKERISADYKYSQVGPDHNKYVNKYNLMVLLLMSIKFLNSALAQILSNVLDL